MLKPRQLKFAHLVATGTDPVAAYKVAFQTESKEAAWKGSQRLSKNVQIVEEIERVRKEAEKSAGGAVADLTELLEYLTAVKRTPIGKISPDSPLCQKYTRKVVEQKAPAEQAELFDESELPPVVSAVEKIEMPDKLRAVEMLAKLLGFFSDDRKNDAEAAAAAESMHYMAELRKRKGASA